MAQALPAEASKRYKILGVSSRKLDLVLNVLTESGMTVGVRTHWSLNGDGNWYLRDVGYATSR